MGEPRIYAPMSGLRTLGEDGDDETDRSERDGGSERRKGRDGAAESEKNHDERRERRVDPMLRASVNRRV
ncbi:hypothetical protein ACFQH6_02580 [Halobacteriaceae archaeon GCM10025711]